VLHLKRFEYDAATGATHTLEGRLPAEPAREACFGPAIGAMQKLQGSFSFPTTLRLRRYMAKGARGGGGPPPVYELRAVLSHAGGFGSGHYISFVRPLGGGGGWYRFDDTRVERVAESAAVREQYGGDHAPRGGGLFGLGGPSPSAYMLTYVRRSEARAAEAHAAAAAVGGAPSAEVEALEEELRAAFEAELVSPRRRR